MAVPKARAARDKRTEKGAPEGAPVELSSRFELPTSSLPRKCSAC